MVYLVGRVLATCTMHGQHFLFKAGGRQDHVEVSEMTEKFKKSVRMTCFAVTQTANSDLLHMPSFGSNVGQLHACPLLPETHQPPVFSQELFHA